MSLSSAALAYIQSSFFQLYHEHLPVLDTHIDPVATYFASPLLFWIVVFTVSRNVSAYETRTNDHSALYDLVTRAVFNGYGDPLPTLEALLILSAWPLPLRRQPEDQRWLYSGIAMQKALQNGLHRIESVREYQPQGFMPTAATKIRHARIWRCWCYSSSQLSCELGLPSLVPLDHRRLTPDDSTIFRPEFLAKLQIALQVGRCHDVLDRIDTTHGIRMMRVLEEDIEAICAPLRLSFLQWTPSVEFVHLSLLLDMYCTYLSGGKPSVVSPELQASIARVASRMVDIFANTLSSPGQPPGTLRRLLAHHPKWTMKSATTATFALIKLAYLDRLPSDQIRQIEQSVRLACDALASDPSRENYEYRKVVKVVEVLSRKGVIDSALATNQIKTRFGASVFFELLYTATEWRKQHGILKSNGEPVTASDVAPIQAVDGPANDLTPTISDLTTFAFDDDYWAAGFDFGFSDMRMTGNSTWSFV
ncbi:hypothetical protein M409DRAFT_54748 [Zasmidium cellare ATCC 36951]|uniref:Xylanolytic transcriptional activator regulatory domain-containing protein n=1 Tax=Zasmidium cellare ATCC 36951 TaxID=1080233 RepID=A0A6A6CLG0_ZASCE|nr:uncharacterized protein M409DRAFT_54748 [Zasmidium cellare ATCC 36951]KAF2166990.1 hypothetical protein M409DRAFT_54748 [Zasmidium cellare ATCC 36951]